MHNPKEFKAELKLGLDTLRGLSRSKANAPRIQVFQARIIQQFEEGFKVSIDRSPKNPLSFMEGLCLALLMQGYRQKQVADLLDIGVGTVNIYAKRIRKKLRVRNTQQACYQAIFLRHIHININ